MTGRKRDIPGEQLAESKRLFDSQGPDDNSHCTPRRIQYCVGKAVSAMLPQVGPVRIPVLI